MPMIECLIDRDGPTIINDGGFTFTFKENEAGHKVANVLSGGTTARLLTFSWFRKYRPEIDYPENGKEEEPTSQVVDVADDLERIKLLRAEGMSMQVIANSIGKSKTYVAKKLKDD